MRDAHPTEQELHGLVDGMLDAAKAASVIAHCEGCATCAEARDGLAAVVRATQADSDEGPPEPVWPHVQRRLRRGLPRFGWTFALGTGLAVSAGLWIGLAFGSGPRASSTEQDTTRTTSTGLYTTWESSLPDVYGLLQDTEAGGS